MPDSPENHQISKTQKRICDFCSETIALLYCRADSAKLCLSCDREVHSTNPLFTKHTRFQLCDGCDCSPASIFCSTEQSILCQNCDFEIHRSCSVHDRRPLEGFTGCPSVTELSAFVGLEEFDCKSALDDGDEREGFFGSSLSWVEKESDGFSDFLVWDTPAVVSIDELIISTDTSHNFQAMVVPPLPKDRKLSCGKHKQQILHQLRHLGKSEPKVKHDSNPLLGNQIATEESEKDLTMQHTFRAYQYDEEHATHQGPEARSFSCGNDADDAGNDIFLSSVLLGSHNEEGVLNSDKHSSMGSGANLPTNGLNSQNQVRPESFTCTPKVIPHEFSSACRDSAISRYKEKKRTRRYDQHIRYESRKVQAESRTRIRGRFAKDGQTQPSVNQP